MIGTENKETTSVEYQMKALNSLQLEPKSVTETCTIYLKSSANQDMQRKNYLPLVTCSLEEDDSIIKKLNYKPVFFSIFINSKTWNELHI